MALAVLADFASFSGPHSRVGRHVLGTLVGGLLQFMEGQTVVFHLPIPEIKDRNAAADIYRLPFSGIYQPLKGTTAEML